MISLNLQSCFVLAGILIAFWRARQDKAAFAGWSFGRLDVLASGALALTVAIAFGWMASSYFLSDDFILLKLARTWTWRGVFTTPGGDGFFRPLGDLFYVASARAAGSSPGIWHWIGFALHAANTLLVYVLAILLGYTRFAAWCAAMLFALHAAHPEAVVWMAGRFDLLACLFVLAGLIAFLRFLAWANGGGVWTFVAAVAMIAGLLSKESAYSFPVLAAMLVVCTGNARSRRAWTAVLGFGAITAAVFVYRWRLQGGIGGYGQVSVLGSVKALLFRMWAILFFPVNRELTEGWWLGVLAVAYIAALVVLFLSRAERAKLIYAVGFTILAAAPAVSQLSIGPDLEKSRVLYLPSVGFCLLMGALAGYARIRTTVAAVLIVFQAAALWHNLTGWQKASEMVQSVCKAAADCAVHGEAVPQVNGLPRIWHGVYTFANGYPECVEMNRRSNASRGSTGSADCRFLFDDGSGTIKPVK